jgi:folate-binding protein YgfZ
MARTSPLLPQYQAAGALLSPYGPADDADPIALVQTFGEVDLEYAAVRRGVGVLDLPQRATIELTGDDGIDFLNRMLTQELKVLAPFQSRRAFWLARNGRIDADLRVTALPGRLLIECDAHALKRTLGGLTAYVITEDATFTDRTNALHRVGLYGRHALALLARVATPVAGPAPLDLRSGTACLVDVGGCEALAEGDDATGEPGCVLTLPTERVPGAVETLLRAGGFAGDDPAAHGPGWALRERDVASLGARPIGWAAFNTARIEAGTIAYYLDFGPTSLPHETGPAGLSTRVSFTKGCYLGQEVVARMHALGKPKMTLVALRLTRVEIRPATPHSTDPAAPFEPPIVAQPDTGSPVFARGSDGTATGDPIGAVTSSTISPMLGNEPIAFAMVKTALATPGSTLVVDAEGTPLAATVQPTTAFWRPAGKSAPH